MKINRQASKHRQPQAEDKLYGIFEQAALNKSERYRSSCVDQYRQATQRDHKNQEQNRYSFNLTRKRKNDRFQEYPHTPNKAIQNLKNTLSHLQSIIDNAKEQLMGNKILGKDVIFEEDQEESRTLELISFNESDISKRLDVDQSLQQNQKLLLESLKRAELLCLRKIKGYYKIELSKMILTGNPRALQHLKLSCKAIRSIPKLTSLNPQEINLLKKNVNLEQRKDLKKTLVLDLDQTLIHCEWQRESAEDIDICLPVENGQLKTAFISIRPYAISFLKKMNKHFEIIIFTQRSQVTADLILDQLDPYQQLIQHRLYNNHCFEIIPNIFTKDIRIINRDLQNVLFIDNSPYSYIYQLQNAIPILPYYSGHDCQLYALQKYLEEALKRKNLQYYNNQYFQLKKYGQYGPATEVAHRIYFMKQ